MYEGLGRAETPVAIRAQLHAAGMRAISPVVDITNYVMLVVGEPMHAFDLDLVAGSSLTVKAAAAGEVVETLDGQSRELKAGELLIADSDGPTSIAGVMGGARSEVSDSTTRVLLEAAVWDGPTIHDTSLRLALRSEASGRFEKGLSPIVTERAQAYASVLFEKIFGVKPVPGTVDISSEAQGAASITLPDGLVSGLLGYEVPEERVTGSLERLAFSVAISEGAIEVVPPPDRPDVERQVDLIEEIARIDGLERIPSTLPSAGAAGGLSSGQSARRRLAGLDGRPGLLRDRGWSFASPGLPDALRLADDDPARQAIVIENPMSEEESRLRTTPARLAARLSGKECRSRSRSDQAFRAGTGLPAWRRFGRRPTAPGWGPSSVARPAVPAGVTRRLRGWTCSPLPGLSRPFSHRSRSRS